MENQRIGSFYYDEQIKRYAAQFNAIFTGLQVQVGKSETKDIRLIPVPIVHGSMDRVAAAAAQGHTQNKHIRLPMLSSNISGFNIANDRMKGTGITRREVYTPLGDLPENSKVVRNRMAVPYDLTFDLYIYASNKDQQFQILEQILVMFDPVLQIQTSTSQLDPSKIATVELMTISNDDNFLPGADSRTILSSIQFKVDAYLTIPATVKNDIVNKVIARVAAIDEPGIGTIFSSGKDNGSIPQIFDDLNIQPEIWVDSDPNN
jgi:hypothetical protein